jgi:hypothetical protein
MELGKIQKAWIASLRKHPERQMVNSLGKGGPRDYKACCLGEYLITECRVKKKRTPFNNGYLFDSSINDTGSLCNSYERLGLSGRNGDFINSVSIKEGKISNHLSLATANDSGVTWPEIADFIEANPENVFTKSV